MSVPEPLRWFFRLAFGITWGVGAVGLVLPGTQLAPGAPVAMLAGYGPSLAGLLVTAWVSGRHGVRALLASAVPRLSHVGWYLGIVVAVPLLALAGQGITGGARPGSFPGWSAIPGLLGWSLLVDSGPLGEELGWRGFALPRLLERHSGVAAGLVLGLVWALWHAPTFFIRTLPQSHLPPLPFVVSTLGLSVLQAGLFVWTRGDLAAVILQHAVSNLVASFVPIEALAVAHVAAGLAVAASPVMRVRPSSAMERAS